MDELLPYEEGPKTLGACQRQSVTERLQEQKRSLESRLKCVNDALTALEKNPGFASTFEALNKALR